MESRLFCASFFRSNAKQPEDRLLAVAAVTAGVDADGGKLAALAPAFDGEW